MYSGLPIKSFVVSSRFFLRSEGTLHIRAKHTSLRCNEPWPQTRACFSFLTLRTTDRSASYSFLSVFVYCQETGSKGKPVLGTRRDDFLDTLCVTSVCLFCPQLSFHRDRGLSRLLPKNTVLLLTHSEITGELVVCSSLARWRK